MFAPSTKRFAVALGILALLLGIPDFLGAWSPALTPQNLQGHWRLDDGSGTTATDDSTNSFDGTLTNGPTWSTGQKGGALSFDGTDDYVDLGTDIAILNSVSQATLATWVKVTTLPGSGQNQDLISLSKNAASATNSSRATIRLTGDGTAADLVGGGRSNDSEGLKLVTAASSDLAAGQWYHVAAVIDYAGDKVDLYVDGVLSTSGTVSFAATATPNTNSTSTALGAEDDGSANYLNGLLDDVRVYARGLSAAEISMLSNQLEAHYKLDEGSGTTANDETPNRFDGTLQNGTAWSTSGKEGDALDFDGTDDYVDLGSDIAILNRVSQATLAAWVKIETLPGSGVNQDLISLSQNAGSPTLNSRATIRLTGDGTAADLKGGGRSNDTEGLQLVTASSSNLAADQWYHVAAVIDYANDTVDLYVDGSLSTSGSVTFTDTATPNTNSTSTALGAEDNGNGNHFDGLMDEVRVYSRALSADEIRGLAGGNGTGLSAVYYDNKDWTGTFITRTDETIDFDWASGSPDAAIGNDTFSAVWTGQVQPRWSETYTFTTETDDGVKLWVDGNLIVDFPQNMGATEKSGTLALSAGTKYDLRMEYFENGGLAVAKLKWESLSTPKAIIPKEQLYPTDGVAPTFDTATAESGDLQTVYLRFSEPMDKTTSETAGNYTVSGPITVNSATLSSDKRVVTLAVASNVTLGTTTVTASASIKSIAQEAITQTVRTIVAGNSLGIPDSTAITLALATDTDNQSVIQKDPGGGSFDVPDKGLKVDLTVTAPGTTATTVDLAQSKLVDGKSVILFGLTGSDSTTSVTTSGGTPNNVTIKVRGSTAGAFKDDFKILASVSGDERASKLSTVVNLSYSPQCLHLADQRPVTQTLTTTPAIQGLKINMTTWVVTRTNHASATTLFAAPNFPDTGSDGKSTRTFTPCGQECYGAMSGKLKDTTGNSVTSDYKETIPCEHCPPGIGPNPGQKTNSGSSSCPCSDSTDRKPVKTPKGGNKGEASVDPRFAGNNSIDPTDGEKKLDIADLVIRGRGLDYVFRRIYRSHDYRATIASNANRGSDFGDHWTFTYADEYLLKDGSGSDNDANYFYFREAQTGGVFVNVSSGVWEAPNEALVQLRKNSNSSEFEIRQYWGDVRFFHDFSDTGTPNKNGRLKAIEDRNNNKMSFLYDQIDPDGVASNGDEKFVLTRVVDSMGREIRYEYYAATGQSSGGRTLTILESGTGARGRLARVKDFKGDMDFSDADASEDFPNQINNRTLFFDYDSESNLVRCSSQAVAGTPTSNNFASGKTTRYKYITTLNRGGLSQAAWDALSQSEKDRLLHNLTHIWYPNEVKNTPGTDPADADAAEVITYETDKTDAFFGYVTSYQIGGQNGNGVPSGGTINYTWTDLNSDRSMPPGVAADPTILYAEQNLKVVIVDRNGNDSEYIYGGGKNLLEYREKTLDNFRTTEPDEYLIKTEHNGDRYLKKFTSPEGNTWDHTFNESSTDRFQQGNLVRTIRTPDLTRGGDQDKIEMVYVYEPIYNRPCLVVQGRGSDIDNNDFTPPVTDPAIATRQVTDPYDAAKKIDLRYARVEFFDYQESTEKASAAPDTRLDIDGSGGKVNLSPLISVDPNVLTTHVWLVQELGLSEDSGGLTELKNRLSNNLTKLGLGDLNGDNDTTPRISGNIIRTIYGSPVLINGTNQHALEQAIDPADLIDASKGYQDGGPQESATVTNQKQLQTIVWMYRYNALGQVIQTISPEGNVTTHEYFAENDPDGDTTTTPAPADGRTLDTVTGGYLKKGISDRTRTDADVKFFDQSGTNKDTATFHNNDTAPTDTDITTSYTYDDVGNVVTMTNPRGIRDDFFVNELNEAVQVERAKDISGASSADPSDPLFGASIGALTAFAYKSRTFYDFNGYAVLSQTEDRGNTSSVDGSGLGALPSQATDTTPGLSSADAAGGDAFVDSLVLYDRINDVIETRVEVDNSTSLDTQQRYDGNQHQVLTIYPEGNADSSEFDERELLFQMTKGTRTRPTAGKYAAGDPTSFKRLGTEDTDPSTFTYNYDDNMNIVEFVDAADTDLGETNGSNNNSDISGAGDITVYAYDGYDRLKVTINADGNRTTRVYDPDSNVIRTIMDGDPVDDFAPDADIGSSGFDPLSDNPDTPNKSLSVSEYAHDSLSRVVATHQVLFQTPVAAPTNTPTLTDGVSMDSLAEYLSDANSDTSAIPGATGITVIGRVSSIQGYDRESRSTFRIQDDLDLYRTDYDGASRSVRTMDSHVATGFSGGTFTPANQKGNVVLLAYDDNSNVIEVREFDVIDIDSNGTADSFDANHDGAVNASDTVIDFDLDGTNDADAEVFRSTVLYDSLDRAQTSVDNVTQTMDQRYDSRSNRVSTADAQGPVNTRSVSRRWKNPLESTDTDTTTITVNDFGNVTRSRFDGISRLLESEVVLTASGQGDGVKVGATLEGVQAMSGGDVDYTDVPTRDSNQSTDGLISVYYAYDDNSQLLALRDDNGNTTAYIYDNQNRTLKERKGLAETGASFTITGGDSGSFVKALRGGTAPVDSEPSGTDIVYTYDKDSNVTKIVDEATNTLDYTYDALNRRNDLTVTKATGFIGTTSQTWEYDGLSRQGECTDNNDTGTGDDVICRYFYDSLSRKVEEGQEIGASTGFKDLSCSYDIQTAKAVWQPSQCTYPDGRKVDSTYDTLDRLVDRTDNGQGSAIGSYTYIGKWREATLTFQNETRLTHIGQTTTNAQEGFDDLRRITKHRWESFTSPDTTPGNDTLLVGFGHELGTAGSDGRATPAYDRMSNKLIEEKLHDSNSSEVYVYDSAYRVALPTSTYRSPAPAQAYQRGTLNANRDNISTLTTRPGQRQKEDWTLDGPGNWATNPFTDQGVAAVSETRNHTDFNEINQRTISTDNTTHTLDKNGNITDTGKDVGTGGSRFFGGGLRMEWDALNRLRKVHYNANTPGSTGDDTLIAEYSYDCGNRRMRRIFTNNTSALNGTTDYYYESWRVYEEHDAADAITQQYTYGNYLDDVWTLDDRRSGGTVAQLNDGTGSQRRFYHCNTLYSIFALTDEAGSIDEAYQYNAYGTPTVWSGAGVDTLWFTNDDVISITTNGAPLSAVGNPYLYTGQRLDSYDLPETSLYYYKNRYYSNDLGRMASRDRAGYRGGRFLSRDFLTSQPLGLYEYGNNAPSMYTDPLGLQGHRFGPTLDPGAAPTRDRSRIEISEGIRMGYALDVGAPTEVPPFGRRSCGKCEGMGYNRVLTYTWNEDPWVITDLINTPEGRWARYSIKFPWPEHSLQWGACRTFCEKGTCDSGDCYPEVEWFLRAAFVSSAAATTQQGAGFSSKYPTVPLDIELPREWKIPVVQIVDYLCRCRCK